MKAAGRAPDCPSVLVTVTSTTPAASAGVVAEMLAELLTVTPVAATAPNFTVAPDWKFAPVMVTAVPPTVEPEAGAILVAEGAGAGPGVELQAARTRMPTAVATLRTTSFRIKPPVFEFEASLAFKRVRS